MAIYYSNTWNVSLILPPSPSRSALMFFLLVSGLPNVIYLNIFCQRIDLSPIGGIWSPVPAQRDGAPRSRTPRFDGFECVEKSRFEFSGVFLIFL
jgi:hypothetical protein